MNVIISSPRILYLWGLFLSLLVFLWTRKNKTTLSSFQFAELVSTNNNSTIFLRGYRLLIMLCIVCIFFILSWPKRAEEKQQISKSGIDIVIALDTSYSMEASDLTPKRLESAKRALQQFINTRISDRIWLVLFAGKPFTSVPLTFDYAIFEEVLARTTTMTIDQQYRHLQWTAIGDALLNSITVLEKENKPEQSDRERIIVLFTDGEANEWVDPKVVAQLAAEKKIKIYSVGIWSLAWWVIKTPTAFGVREQRVNGVDESTLRTISETTDGVYARAVDDTSLHEIIEKIGQLTRTEAEMETYQILHDARRPFVIMLFICMLLIILFDRKVVL